MTKSPLTGFIGDSLSSSFLATELKKSCGDALIIVGQAETPTLLFIEDGVPQFLDATGLMGLGTFDTEQAVKERLGRQTRVASIGPAGENLVRYASIANDGGRQAGRCGLGAVMGSKNLKAVALKGTEKIPIINSDWLNNTGRELTRKSLGPATEKYRTLGTIANVSVFNRLETLPTLNFQKSSFDEAEKIKIKHASANITINSQKNKIPITDTNGNVNKIPVFEISQLARERSRELAKLIMINLSDNSIDQTGYSKILLTGGGSLLPGITQVFESVLLAKTVNSAPTDIETNEDIYTNLSAFHSSAAGLIKWSLNQHLFGSILKLSTTNPTQETRTKNYVQTKITNLLSKIPGNI